MLQTADEFSPTGSANASSIQGMIMLSLKFPFRDGLIYHARNGPHSLPNWVAFSKTGGIKWLERNNFWVRS